jgi:tRNA(Ile2) C34 agmatinyltransferase TiaS
MLSETTLEAQVPQCPQCHGNMKVAFLVSGKRQDFVGYTCDKCGKHICDMVPSEPSSL